MKANGWKAVPVSAIPVAVRITMLTRMGYLQNAWFIRLQGTVTSPIIIPGGAFLVPQQILVPGSLIKDMPKQ
jgi:hypothetical protein